MILCTGIILDGNGNPSHCKIGFQSSSPNIKAGGVVVAPTTKYIYNSSYDGSFSILLEAGTYSVTYYQSAVTTVAQFTIYVPVGTSSISIDQLTSLPTPPSLSISVWNAVALGSGASSGVVSGLNLAYSPVAVILTVQLPDTIGENIFASIVGSPTTDGFTYSLSAATDRTGYILHYLILN